MSPRTLGVLFIYNMYANEQLSCINRAGMTRCEHSQYCQTRIKIAQMLGIRVCMYKPTQKRKWISSLSCTSINNKYGSEPTLPKGWGMKRSPVKIHSNHAKCIALSLLTSCEEEISNGLFHVGGETIGMVLLCLVRERPS